MIGRIRKELRDWLGITKTEIDIAECRRIMFAIRESQREAMQEMRVQIQNIYNQLPGWTKTEEMTATQVLERRNAMGLMQSKMETPAFVKRMVDGHLAAVLQEGLAATAQMKAEGEVDDK